MHFCGLQIENSRLSPDVSFKHNVTLSFLVSITREIYRVNKCVKHNLTNLNTRKTNLKKYEAKNVGDISKNLFKRKISGYTQFSKDRPNQNCKLEIYVGR